MAARRVAGLGTFLSRPWEILRSVRREDLPADLMAGFTVAAVAIPQAIAYASIAELPPHYGLYTAAVAAIVGSLWGCSRFLATGPVNAVSLLVLPILLAVAVPGSPEFLVAASLIAVLAGLLSIVMATLGFGALETLASRSVLLGFTAGAAIHIAVGQVRHLLGLDMTAVPELHRTVAAIFTNASQTNPYSLGLGVGTLILVIALRWLLGPRFPAALASIAVAAVAVALLSLEAKGVRIVGSIPRSLPPPTWIATGMLPDLQMIRGVVVGAMAVAALGLIEAVAAAQSLARMTGDRLNPNQEFFGQGMANVAAGIFSGYPCSGSFTRSALAQQSGARTHLTGVFTGAIVLTGMLLLAPYVGRIPKASIAGVLFVVAWKMIDREGIRRVFRTSRGESAILLVTFGATLVLPLDFAVLAGVVFSLAFFVIRSSLPRVVSVVPDPTFRHLIHDPDRPVCPQLGIVNIRGPLFFGAVHHVEAELRQHRERYPGQNLLVLRLHSMDFCDLTGIEMLEATVKDYRRLNGDVFMVRPRKPVLATMTKSGFLDDTLGRDHILGQEGTIEFLFEKRLDPSVCIYECEHRVFAECQALEKHPYDAKLPPAPAQLEFHDRLVPLEQFQELASDPETLVFDIREQEEYRRGHVPGAKLLPLRLLLDEAPRLPRDRPLLLVCRSGRRGSRALHMLADLGFTNVHGLVGGTLAWQAAGLPLSHAPEQDAVPDAARRERHVLAMMQVHRRTEELHESLDYLASTEDLPALKNTLERLLDQLPPPEPRPSGCVRLDPSKPVLIISDAHAQRRALHKLLLDKYLGETTNLESVIGGKLQLLLLGNILHSESKSGWEAIRDEFAAQSGPDGSESGPTPLANREMANAFGLAAMIMTLQSSAESVHCLKGNQDNLLDSEENGNRRIAEQISEPGEGEITKDWTLVRFGGVFAGKYAAWENRLPVLALCDNRENGLAFVASHAEPAAPYTLEQIDERSDEVVLGLTWTRGEGLHAPQVLQNVLGPDRAGARYFVGHAGSEIGVQHVSGSDLVIIKKPRSLVAALVQPHSREFEIHIVSDS
jgi:SulP family sulfate permease